jgi:PEP-CTERM motif
LQKSSRFARFGLISASPIALAAGSLAFAATPAAASCTLSSPTTWSLMASGNWFTAGNWSTDSVPNSSSTNVCVVDGTSAVAINGSPAVASLQVAAGNSLNVQGTLFVFGPSLINAGTITVPNSTLQLGGNVTLSGGGAVQMSSDAFLNQSSSGLTLTNQDNTIEGTGQLGQNGLALNNQSGGTVNANVSSGTLSLNGGGAVTNAGLLEATGGGVLQINNNVSNTGGAITASGSNSTVNVNATITGGTLNTTGNGVMNGQSATLNGVTVSSGSTYNVGGATTLLQGTITNNGTFTVPNGALQINGGDVTLTGGGLVQMSDDAFLNQSSSGLTLHNVNNTIEGTGQLGQNGLALDNQSGGTVNANGGGTLTLNGGGTVTNAGLLEATNGGILQINNTVNNSSNITANGGTVNVNAAINGGTLNTTGGGVMDGQSATLNGVTLSTGSTYNVGGSTTLLQGTITNNGTFTVPNGTLQVNGGDVTLTGGGLVQMSQDAFFNQSSSGLTLHNVNNTIEGTGQLGQNGLALDNQSGGTVNANGGGTLSLNGGGAVTNAGLLEATGGGILQVSNNVTNTGAGNLLANGGTVNVSATINGGTVNTTGGGVMQTNGTAVLNGVTLSTGSAYGALGTTYLEGTITNNGTITVPDTTLQTLNGNVTLTGSGTVQMSGNAFFNQSASGQTLFNVSNTIEGTGQLGQNGLALVNEGGGTILANVSAGTLYLNGGGAVTNEGTFKVVAGSTLDAIGDGNGLVQQQGASGSPLTQVDGALDVPNGFKLEAGVLAGTGTVVGNVNNSGGAVHPGDPDPPGILTIDGNYTQGSGGAFDELLAGLAAGTGYSQLDVTGSASLDGLLDVTKSPSFTLAVGDTFTILDFASSTGDFSSFDYNGAGCSLLSTDMWGCARGVQFAEQFASGDTMLDLVVEQTGSVIPEPSTWAMMMIGFAGLGFATWRRASVSAA